MTRGDELAGKVALVTGGARNIGRAIARSLGAGGAAVMVNAIVLDGAFICTQACLPHLKRAGGGAVVNIGGLTGHKGAPSRVHVVTSKGGLAAMTKGLALDLAPHKITVNCVVPGTVHTVRGSASAPELPEYRRSVPPVGRRGEPEEVAAVVRMLCGPDSRYITGQSIHVNGGGLMP